MAVTLSPQDLVNELHPRGIGGPHVEIVAKLLAVASAIVNQEGGETAPDAVSNEAVVLVAGYLQKRHDGSVSEKKMGDLNIKYRAVGSAVRLSGARTLLGPWRVRGLPVEPT